MATMDEWSSSCRAVVRPLTTMECCLLSSRAVVRLPRDGRAFIKLQAVELKRPSIRVCENIYRHCAIDSKLPINEFCTEEHWLRRRSPTKTRVRKMLFCIFFTMNVRQAPFFTGKILHSAPDINRTILSLPKGKQSY